MIVKTSSFLDATKRVSRISSPKLRYENGAAVSAYAKTLINIEFFADRNLAEVKCIGDAQVFSEILNATPEIGEKSFAVAVYPGTLLAILSSAESVINVSIKEDTLVLKTGSRSVHKLKSHEGVLEYFQTFTAKPPKMDSDMFDVNAIDFRTALSYCLHATGDRFDFVNLRTIDNTIWMAGTDGYRAAFVNDIGEHTSTFDINVGTREARLIYSVIPNDEIDVNILVIKDRLYLSFENFSSNTALTRTLTDVFSILDGKEKPTHAVLGAEVDTLKRAISFLTVMSAEGTKRSSLNLDGDSVRMTSIAQQVGDTTWVIPIINGTFPQESLEIDFNPSFVGKYLSIVNPSEVNIHLGKSPYDAIFLESENKNQIFMFMPMQ